ncbi:MAG: TetR/AcrR family transcriptional regulator [Hyphomonas sp.]|uniref:TetR/AcrR family transcriptional regulator n=1 Tax=Hyphomonas sp. TaxID=87 RepID=UPI0017C4F3E3|nr:TetR/AcrR family transcriptional regulator [Hyphomonas sp.]MBU3918971.1 TetR/AcrR family transcriptional regulator [Alphaproteobacteria bacterium]MBA3067548.1 TetR/AcrR family transcriptional regulator [Hyphomonas sp.]MBU4063436.1 TetR/AcrR family transcriptional regulator [Alphaproteobacteria bacterium]MBU4165257.1 TetR/AcrR family transcriptional regulator [Alphaproteobacteria bacterium]MBU4569586.1 TetR/AcrR family transcriptional regulator [Alphaproteobacteria bacterium]
MSISKNTSSRIRRSPEASRENILIAAERLLVRQGPQSLRLADVAKEAGVANATVLHHFGTIDGVQTALMEKMIVELVSGLMAMDVPDDPRAARAAAIQNLFDAFETKGAARLAAWLELTDESRRLRTVREAVQTVIRLKIGAEKADEARLEDAILVSVILAIGVGLFGPTLSELLGKPRDRARVAALRLLETGLEEAARKTGQ